MATVDQLVSRMKLIVSRRTGMNIDQTLIDCLVEAQQDILEKDAVLPNFLKALVSFTVAGAHSGIALATQAEMARFLRPMSRDDIASLEYLDTSGVYQKIPRFDSWDQLYQRYPGTGTYPSGYYWSGSVVASFNVQPTPIGNVTYQARFYRADTQVPAVGTSTLWSTHAGNYLMHTAGLVAAQYLRDKDALTMFSSMRNESYQRFLRQIEAQDMADTDLVMGDD